MIEGMVGEQHDHGWWHVVLPKEVPRWLHEAALNHGLGMMGQTFRRPVAGSAVEVHRILNVSDESVRVAEDARSACIPNARVLSVGFLSHRPHDTRELGESTLDQCSSERDVSEHTVEGIFQVVIVGLCKESAGHRRPVFSRGDTEFFFRFEIVKERSLGHACSLTQIIDGHCGESLLAYQRERGVEEL